jgi:hypothetical protein
MQLSTIKKEVQTMKRRNPVNRRRLSFQGANRNLGNLDSKIKKQNKIIKTGRKEVTRKSGDKFYTVNKILTAAELEHERATLEDLILQRLEANEKVKDTSFDYKRIVKAKKTGFINKRRKFRNSISNKKIETVEKLVDLASKKKDLNEKLKEVQKSLGSSNYNDKRFQKDILAVIKEVNRSRPITRLSKDALKSLKNKIK